MNQLNDDGTCCKHCKDCITFNYERIGENGKKQNFVYCYGGMDRVHDAKWYIDNSGYARSTNKINNGKAVLFHTFFKKNEWNVIDHINGYRNDNRLCNLRECTLLQNMHNLHTDKHSEFPGVMFNKRTKKWYAVTQVKAVRGVKQFGTYDTEVEAYHAYVTGLAELGLKVNEYTDAHKEYLDWLSNRKQTTLI